MTDARQFLMKYGAPVLFSAVFIEQMGLPIPALPWMLAVGALAATGQFSLLTAVSVTVGGCLVADIIWFYLGRFRGTQVLNLLCKISLEPDSCVRKTQNVVTRYGWKGIVVAKFVPGLSTMAPPIAGMTRLTVGRFILTDGAGSLLYGGCFIYLGFFFSNQIDQIENAFTGIGGQAFALILAALAIWLGYKYWMRQRLLKELRSARITAPELRQLQGSGQSLAILDMRSSVELENDPVLIQGAVHLSLDDVKARRYNFPTDCEVIVYCSCPNEITSARVVLMLRQQGFTRVRPLLGGLDAWRDLKFPLANKTAPKPAQQTNEASVRP